MSDPLKISMTVSGTDVTLGLSGELDLSAAGLVNEAVDAIDADATSLVLDLSGLTFIDSSGVRCFIRANDACADAGRRLVLKAPTPPVRRLFDVIDLGQSIEIVD